MSTLGVASPRSPELEAPMWANIRHWDKRGHATNDRFGQSLPCAVRAIFCSAEVNFRACASVTANRK